MNAAESIGFDLVGPLPEGTTVLEASAGTGKTYTIANLVARYVAEGLATMDQMLVVSFSRESTRELRERVRERLVSARDGLSGVAAVPAGDDVLAYLAQRDAGLRGRRLAEAITAFDAATVTTTHGFCQQVMTALGTAGDHDEDVALVENIGDIVAEVADDLYLRKWGVPGAGSAPLPRADFQQLALAAATDPATALLPDPDTPGTPGLRVRVAIAVREEIARRKRRQRLIDYDDLLIRLADTLTDAETGPIAKERLRERYQVVLVDEFQDTDPVQWCILREAFHGHRTLVLIGDPKQAIYGFRGADVHAYLRARETASIVRTLPTNWRSDAALLAGAAAIFRGAALGDGRIRVVPVTAAHPGRMVDVPHPVRLRVLPRDDLALTKAGTAATAGARAAVAHDLAVEIVGLLSDGVTVRPRDGSGPRPARPGDLAVLVRTNAQALLVQARLHAADVPVVLTGKTSVFATPAAGEWQLLLEALEQPHRTTRVRRLALGCFVGLDSVQLDAGGDALADDLALSLRSWAKVLDERGVAALFEAVSLSQRLQPRVLAQVGGERLLTDLRHIASVMHEAALEGQLGLNALLVWLRRRIEEAGREAGQERSRRLETDAAAVQVITIHTSKGLEFPIVAVPFAWDQFSRSEPETAVFHDDTGRRIRDVGGPGSPDWHTHVQRHLQEEVDDELRLTYVALTRAQSHLLLWWAPSYNTPQSPLHRMLLHDDPSTVAPRSIRVPDDATALAAFRSLAAASEGGLRVEAISSRPLQAWDGEAQVQARLDLAALERPLDHRWRRTSYSSMTSSAHEQGGLGSEPELIQKDDETELDEVAAPAGDEHLRAVVSAWEAMPGGTTFGTLVHRVLEELTEPADKEHVGAIVSAQAARYGSGIDADALAAGLLNALATPLGEPAGGAALRDIAANDRLAELDFELPLAGGDEPLDVRVTLRDLGALWGAHRGEGPLNEYPEALEQLPEAVFRGYLTGSIDAVLRVTRAGSPRYLVVDYKTNRLAGSQEPLTAWHYRPTAMERAMVDAHYPLQALLYSVALHRYLRWRQPGYDPAAHLGGVLYLFLRGMPGPDVTVEAGRAPGVFSWRPAPELVLGASDLLAGRS